MCHYSLSKVLSPRTGAKLLLLLLGNEGEEKIEGSRGSPEEELVIYRSKGRAAREEKGD